MMMAELLGAGRVAEVFADGGDVLKLYARGFGPDEARAEARNLDLLRGTSLSVPQAKDVVDIDGRWGLRMTRMPGRPMAEIALEKGDGLSMVSLLAELHLRVLACPGAGLPPLKPRLAVRIARAPRLDDTKRARLVADLEAMPDGDRVCHGDFHPYNIMQDGDRLSIIDWPDATCGAPEADIARSYILLGAHFPVLAEAYMDAAIAGAISRDAVMGWLPFVAAARLDEQIAEETELLLNLCGAD